MRFFRILLAMVLALVAEILLPRYVWEFFRHFDFLLVVVIFNSINLSRLQSTVTGTASGLIQDAFTGPIFGLGGFAKTIVGFAATTFYQRFMVDTVWTQLAVFCVATWLQEAVRLLLLTVLFGQDGTGELFPDILIRTGCNMVGGVLLMRLAVTLFRRLSAGRMRSRGVSRLTR